MTRVGTVVVEDGAGASVVQEVVEEAPLEIRVEGDRLSTTMRTPGHDHCLALGFLFAEGLIHSRADVGSVRHCGRTSDPNYGHVLDVLPGPGARIDRERFEAARRATTLTSACGVCGRAQIEDLLSEIPVLPTVHFASSRLFEAVDALARHQAAFARTGGAHAACAMSREGGLLAHAEDVGRHNAVDKVVGKLLLSGALEARAATESWLLAVSGRVSFEIVQKAARAGMSVLVGVSAPTSLAVRAAERSGMTLAAFVRASRFTLYAHAERVLI